MEAAQRSSALFRVSFLLSPSVSLYVAVLPALSDTSFMSTHEQEGFVSSDSPLSNQVPPLHRVNLAVFLAPLHTAKSKPASSLVLYKRHLTHEAQH